MSVSCSLFFFCLCWHIVNNERPTCKIGHPHGESSDKTDDVYECAPNDPMRQLISPFVNNLYIGHCRKMKKALIFLKASRKPFRREPLACIAVIQHFVSTIPVHGFIKIYLQTFYFMISPNTLNYFILVTFIAARSLFSLFLSFFFFVVWSFCCGTRFASFESRKKCKMALLNIITNLSVLLFDHNMWVKLIKHITIAFIAHIHIRPTGSSTSSMANPKVLLTQPARCISLLCLDPVAHRDPLPPLSLPFPIAGCFPNHNSQSLASQHPPILF